MRYIWIFIVLMVSCNHNSAGQERIANKPLDICGYIPYSQDPNISDKNGKPATDSSSYIPIKYLTEKLWVYYDPTMKLETLERACNRSKDAFSKEEKIPLKSIRDTFVPKSFLSSLCSDELKACNEPILSNYYLNKEVYRLTFIPGLFGHTSTITITAQSGNYICNLKILGEQSNHGIKDTGFYLLTDENISIIKDSFENLSKLINTDSFLTIPYVSCSSGLDDPGFLLEVHTKRGYYFIYRWGFDNNSCYRQVLNFFWRVSDIWRKENEISTRGIDQKNSIKK